MTCICRCEVFCGVGAGFVSVCSKQRQRMRPSHATRWRTSGVWVWEGVATWVISNVGGWRVCTRRGRRALREGDGCDNWCPQNTYAAPPFALNLQLHSVLSLPSPHGSQPMKHRASDECVLQNTSQSLPLGTNPNQTEWNRTEPN